MRRIVTEASWRLPISDPEDHDQSDIVVHAFVDDGDYIKVLVNDSDEFLLTEEEAELLMTMLAKALRVRSDFNKMRGD